MINEKNILFLWEKHQKSEKIERYFFTILKFGMKSKFLFLFEKLKIFQGRQLYFQDLLHFQKDQAWKLLRKKNRLTFFNVFEKNIKYIRYNKNSFFFKHFNFCALFIDIIHTGLFSM